MPNTKKSRRVLLKIEGCPYCRNAEEALDKAGVSYLKVEVDRSDRSIVEKLSGQPTVPILVEVIGAENQDDDIISYIKELQG